MAINDTDPMQEVCPTLEEFLKAYVMASQWKHRRRCVLRNHGPCLIADAALCISTHRKCVPASIWFPWLIVPCMLLLTGSVFLHLQSLIPVTDHPLCIFAHSLCVSLLCCIILIAHTIPFIIPPSWCVAFSHDQRSFNEFGSSYVFAGGIHHIHHSSYIHWVHSPIHF